VAGREAVRYKRSKAHESMGQRAKLQKRLNPQTSFARCAPINPMSRTLEFYLNDAGHAIVPGNSGSSPAIEKHLQKHSFSWEQGRVLQEFQVVYISKGKGVFQFTQGELIPINAGDALLLFPGEWYRYRPDPEVGWVEYWIRFNGDYAKKLMSELLPSSRRPIIRIGHNEALLQLLITLTRTVRTNSNPLLTTA
jgi:hypothetical protein